MSPKDRVFLTRRIARQAMERLEATVALEVWTKPGPPSRQALLEGAAGADGLLCLLSDRVDAALLDASPRLRVISSLSVGLDHVDLRAATERRIPVGHTPGVLAETTADLAWALLLAAARRVVEGDRFVREGGWTEERAWQPDLLLGSDVHGATLGILGLGAIGRAVARRATGFGMRVLGWSRTPGSVAGIRWTPLPELLSRSDFLTVHVALNPQTRGLLDARRLSRLKTGAILVNTARGEVVQEAALVEALRSQHLAAAALDVFETEPLPRESPLLALPNVVLTPHIGSASRATRARMATLAVDNLLAGLSGQRLPRCANPEVFDA